MGENPACTGGDQMQILGDQVFWKKDGKACYQISAVGEAHKSS